MAAVIAVLLLLLPSALYLAWRRLGPPAGEPSSGLVLALLVLLGAAMAAGVWFGQSRSFGAGETYVPARMGADGTVEPGHVERRR